jgi:soluble lytic murein transglycosylase-like protein
MLVSYSVPYALPSRLRLLTATLCAITLAASAHALERVTLRNGFSYDCARREAVDTNHVRLYLADETGSSSNFIDLPATAIATVEPLPDPPKPAATYSPAQPQPGSTNVNDLLAHAGAQHNIDVELLASVVKAESGFHTNAVSRTGARGLMQLMPSTARTLGVNDAFQPDQNIAGGAAYLDYLLTRYHNDISLALAAYNAGPGAVDRYHGVPPFRETRAYVARVENEFIRRKHAASRSAALAVITPH